MAVLRGTKSFYQYELSDALAHNLKSWIDYGLLETGAYTTVKFNLPTSGYTTLRTSYDDRYGGHRRVYEGLGPSWVWETDFTYPSGVSAPVRASGVYVNNTFYLTSTTSGTYGHIIDFRNGRVIFNNKLASSDVVKCEYTFRDVAVYLHDSPQTRTIIDEYLSKFEDIDTISPSGMAMILKHNRVWLPCVVLQTEGWDQTGLQLGGGQIVDVNVFYHIFSDQPFSSNRLADLINNQADKVLRLYDVNSAPFPYNYNGTVSDSAITYPNLGNENSAYFWTFAHIGSSRGGPKATVTDLYRAEVLQTISVDRYLHTY